MQLNDLRKGMEIKAKNKKSAFLCEDIDRKKNMVSGRMITKSGTIGTRVLRADIADIHFAQTILGGCERNGL